MLGTGFTPWPRFSKEEVEAVANVVALNKVNYWTGQEGKAFETEFAGWAGSSHAVAMMNGTVALDAALQALDIAPGDEVIVTPRTFLASVSCVVNAGAVPVFADVDRDSQNITPESIAQKLSKRTRAVIPVHLAGWPCDMAGIMDLANQANIKVIEDCAQAHGARIGGRSVGTFGHIGAWSFCQDKIITTAGEGGMVTTDDEALWSRMWSLKDHGKSWQAIHEQEHPPGFRWLHESFGNNWRMTEMQAAVGRLQLRKMDEWTAARSENAQHIAVAAAECAALRVPLPSTDIQHAWYKFYAFVRTDALKTDWSRDRILSEINALGVPAYSGSCSEVYLEKAFDGTGWRPNERLPVAQELGETSLMLLVHPTLSSSEISLTCEVVADVVCRATR